MIERHLDYFAASLNFPEAACRENEYKLVQAIKFYKRGYEDKDGIRYYYGNPNSTKALCVCSGVALHTLRSNGNSDAAILDAFLSCGACASRVDIAVTEFVADDLVTLDEIESWYKDKKIESTWVAGGMKKVVEVPQDGDNATQTIYIGDMAARGKKGIFRAYDKGVEMGLDKFMVTRLEIEDKGDKAKVTANRLAKTNDVAGIFRTRFNVDDPTFERLMQSPVAELTRRVGLPKRDEIDTHIHRWQWLIKQIAPSIRQALQDDKRLELGDANLSKFLAASGLLKTMRDAAGDLSIQMFHDRMLDSGMLEDDFSNWEL